MKSTDILTKTIAKNWEHLRIIEDNTHNLFDYIVQWNAHRIGGIISRMVLEQILDRVSWVLVT